MSEQFGILLELIEAMDAYMCHPSDASASWKAAEIRFRMAREDARRAIAGCDTENYCRSVRRCTRADGGHKPDCAAIAKATGSKT